MPKEREGVIERAILKSGVGSKWKMSLDEAGQPAVTHYKLLSDNGVLSEVEFSPKTGRTHQIRLHAAFALGCPVVGDPFYGPQEGEFAAAALPMMLHAEMVEIPLQPSKAPIKVSAPLPEHMVKLLSSSLRA